MKKLLLLLSLSLFMFSCEGDGDEETKKSIVGYWEFEYASPVEVITDSEANTQTVKEFIRAKKSLPSWEFKEDGTGILGNGYYRATFNYSINGDRLTTIETKEDGSVYEEEIPVTVQFKINDNILSMIEDWTYKIKYEFPNIKTTKAVISRNYVRH